MKPTAAGIGLILISCSACLAEADSAEPIMQGESSIKIDPSGQVIVDDAAAPHTRPRRAHNPEEPVGAGKAGAPMEIGPRAKQ